MFGALMLPAQACFIDPIRPLEQAPVIVIAHEVAAIAVVKGVEVIHFAFLILIVCGKGLWRHRTPLLRRRPRASALALGGAVPIVLRVIQNLVCRRTACWTACYTARSCMFRHPSCICPGIAYSAVRFCAVLCRIVLPLSSRCQAPRLS